MHEASGHETVKALSAGILSTLLLVLVSASIPLIGFVSSWLIPLPVLFYRTRLSRKVALIIPIASIIVLVIISKGINPDIIFFSALLILGFLLSESFEKLFSIDRTILFSCGGVFLTGCFTLFFYISIANMGYVELISFNVNKIIEMSIELNKEMGVPDEQLAQLSMSKDILILAITRFLPGVSFILLIFTAWINILIAGSIFYKHNIAFAGYGQLKLWKAPEQFVWMTIISIIALMIPNEIIQVISLNIIMVLMFVYFLQGIAITAFFFEKNNSPRGVRVLLYGLIVLTKILLIFIVGMGFFDTWVNFRKTDIDKTGTLND